MGYGTTADKPAEQKTLFLCFIYIHNFRKNFFLVDIRSNNLTILCLFTKYFGRSCWPFSLKEEQSKTAVFIVRFSTLYHDNPRGEGTSYQPPCNMLLGISVSRVTSTQIWVSRILFLKKSQSPKNYCQSIKYILKCFDTIKNARSLKFKLPAYMEIPEI